MMTNHNLSNLNQNADEDSLMVVLVDGGGDIFFFTYLCLALMPLFLTVCLFSVYLSFL